MRGGTEKGGALSTKEKERKREGWGLNTQTKEKHIAIGERGWEENSKEKKQRGERANERTTQVNHLQTILI